MGDDFPRQGTPDDYVEYYKDQVFGELGWMSESRKMVSEDAQQWRYDLIFASQNKTALGIMGEIYTSDLKNDVTEEIREWRAKSDVDQTGIESYVRIQMEEKLEEEPEEGQYQLADFPTESHSSE